MQKSAESGSNRPESQVSSAESLVAARPVSGADIVRLVERHRFDLSSEKRMQSELAEVLTAASLQRPIGAEDELMTHCSFVVPHPSTRVPASMYRDLRAWLLENDPDGPEMLQWSSKMIGPPETPERMAGEIKWIILCAGRSAQAARTIEKRVNAALREGRPVVEAFGYRAKAEAIERAYRERHVDFEALQKVLATNDPVALVDWCGSLPFVGDDTKFQLAKNFGADVVKPDIWLCRLTGIADKPRRAVKYRFPACMALARPLAEATGDRIAAVDSLLWLACNKGVLVVDRDAGPVTFQPKEITTRSIYAAAGESEAKPQPVEYKCDFCGSAATYAVTWERAQRAGLPVNIDSLSGSTCALACKACNDQIVKRAGPPAEEAAQ